MCRINQETYDALMISRKNIRFSIQLVNIAFISKWYDYKEKKTSPVCANVWKEDVSLDEKNQWRFEGVIFKFITYNSPPSHYLNQWWNIVNANLRNKLQWNFNQISNILIDENAFENVVYEMVANLCRRQCVNMRLDSTAGECLSNFKATYFNIAFQCFDTSHTIFINFYIRPVVYCSNAVTDDIWAGVMRGDINCVTATHHSRVRELQVEVWMDLQNWHDDVIKWKHFPRYWPFVRGIHRSPVNPLHKGQWRGALMFSLNCVLNKRLSKQSWGWWFDTPTRSLWRHCNGDEVIEHTASNVFDGGALFLHKAIIQCIPPQTDTIRTSQYFAKWNHRCRVVLCQQFRNIYHLVKSWSLLIGCYNDRIALKFEKHFRSAAADVSLKFQSDWIGLNPNLAASRLHDEILRRDVRPLGE